MYMWKVYIGVVVFYETHLFRVSEELNLIPLIVGENSLYIFLLNQLHVHTKSRREASHSL